MPPPTPARAKLISRIQIGLSIAMVLLFIAAFVRIAVHSHGTLPLSRQQHNDLALSLGLVGVLLALAGASHIYFRRDEVALMQERLRRETGSETVPWWASERTFLLNGVVMLCLGLVIAIFNLVVGPFPG